MLDPLRTQTPRNRKVGRTAAPLPARVGNTEEAMPLYRATGNLVIRPCATCLALVLHEEGMAANGEFDDAEVMPARWRPFPHHAPGGAACIGGGSMRTPANKVLPRAAAAARRVRAPNEKRPYE